MPLCPPTSTASWLREARDDIPLQQIISKDVVEWERRGKPRDRLYRSSQLKEAQAWASRNTPSGNEVAFLRAGTAQRMRSIANVAIIMLLLLSTTGIAGWLLLHRPLDPTFVTTLNDAGPGSLRNAIDEASPKSTISFDTSLRGTILLTSNDLNIAKNLTIRGPGAGILSISSGKSGYVVHVLLGVTVTFSGLTFRDSRTSKGIIDNEGTLTLTNSSVSNNTALYSSIVGGIYNTGTLTLTNSTISGNTAQYGNGGGIDNGGTLTLTNSTISGNAAQYGSGSGIAVTGSNTNNGSIDTLTLTNSTISGNRATGNGGGIAVITGTGGNFTQEVLLLFCTLYGNTADVGGGIWDAVNSSISVVTQASIVAGNKAHAGPDISTFIDLQFYNLIGNLSGTSFPNFIFNTTRYPNVLGISFTALKIDPVLRDNGGSGQFHTWTHALLTGSPAIDAIPLQYCRQIPYGFSGGQSLITTDQRGIKRPDGNEQFCDIGAYGYVDSST